MFFLIQKGPISFPIQRRQQAASDSWFHARPHAEGSGQEERCRRELVWGFRCHSFNRYLCRCTFSGQTYAGKAKQKRLQCDTFQLISQTTSSTDNRRNLLWRNYKTLWRYYKTLWRISVSNIFICHTTLPMFLPSRQLLFWKVSNKNKICFVFS